MSFNRLMFAAARVVMRAGYVDVAHSLDQPGTPTEIESWIDWDATRAWRKTLAASGFGVAEAMDTAQRFSLGWPIAERLIRETASLELDSGFIAGAGADHVPEIDGPSELSAAVVHQAKLIQSLGGWVIILPLPWLAERHADEDTYVTVYQDIITAIEGPVFIHWLGEAFHPGLRDYFPGSSFSRVMALDKRRVRGCKLSLLDRDLEIKIRAELLPNEQIVLTGDDLHFSDLILGEGAVGKTVLIGSRSVPIGNFSHGLLGILDGIHRPAARAFTALAEGRIDDYRLIMTPCEELARLIFEPPTSCYRAGLAFLGWLAGDQETFSLANHEERARSSDHYRRLADAARFANVIEDDEPTRTRLASFGLR